MKQTQIIIPLLLLLLLTGLLASCGITYRTLVRGKLRVQIHVSQMANQNSPVALDLLLIYDKALFEELLEVSAKEWFDKREQYKRDHLAGQAFQVWSWEWVPGQKIAEKILPIRARTKGGIIFASYSSPGDHRLRFHPYKKIRINLGKNDFEVQRPE